MASVTFNILPGSTIHPSMATIIYPGGGKYETDVSRWNYIGYIPFVSTITGCCRALLGIIHTIAHLVLAIFDSQNRAFHMEQAALGGRNIVRGAIEMMPIVGNLALLIMDIVLGFKATSAAKDYYDTHRNEVRDRMVLFMDNENVASKTQDEFQAICLRKGYNLSNIPQYRDLVHILQQA